MPKHKDLKRVVRRRMDKTGESYTAARARVLAKRDRAASPDRAGADVAEGDPAEPAEPARERYAELAGMAEATVAARTGHGWAEWVALLDGIDAASMSHGEIAAWVAEQHTISGWWSQTVAVGYERIRGLRKIGQRRDGSFEVGKSKTYPVPVERLYDAFAEEGERERWLPGVQIEVRTCTRPKTVRWLWEDGNPVEAYFTAKGAGKSSVSVQHRQLTSRAAADASKAEWGERLQALAEALA